MCIWVKSSIYPVYGSYLKRVMISSRGENSQRFKGSMILIKNVAIEDFENLEVNWPPYSISIAWSLGTYWRSCKFNIYTLDNIIKGLALSTVSTGALFHLTWCLMIKYPSRLIIRMCMCEGVEGMKGLCLDREAPESVSSFVYSCRTFNPLGAVCKRM